MGQALVGRAAQYYNGHDNRRDNGHGHRYAARGAVTLAPQLDEGKQALAVGAGGLGKIQQYDIDAAAQNAGERGGYVCDALYPEVTGAAGEYAANGFDFGGAFVD